MPSHAVPAKSLYQPGDVIAMWVCEDDELDGAVPKWQRPSQQVGCQRWVRPAVDQHLLARGGRYHGRVTLIRHPTPFQGPARSPFCKHDGPNAAHLQRSHPRSSPLDRSSSSDPWPYIRVRVQLQRVGSPAPIRLDVGGRIWAYVHQARVPLATERVPRHTILFCGFVGHVRHY